MVSELTLTLACHCEFLAIVTLSWMNLADVVRWMTQPGNWPQPVGAPLPAFTFPFSLTQQFTGSCSWNSGSRFALQIASISSRTLAPAAELVAVPDPASRDQASLVVGQRWSF